jgi:hypothetical protein
MDQHRMQKLFKYYNKMKACSQNSSKYKIYQQKIQYYLEGGVFTNPQLITYLSNIKKKINSFYPNKSGVNLIIKPYQNLNQIFYYDTEKIPRTFYKKTSYKQDFTIIIYTPTEYTDPKLLPGKKSIPDYADSDTPKDYAELFNTNDMKNKHDRRSYTVWQYPQKELSQELKYTDYKIEEVSGRPVNPHGLTGFTGRTRIGRWGPNHAVDPIVSRYVYDIKGNLVKDANNLPQIEFVLILRKGSNDWALPGGIVEAGDSITQTLKKEFGEEALNSLEATESGKKEINTNIDILFRNGFCVYRGINLGDPRNTDNAWMETDVFVFHDTNYYTKKIKLSAGDDAGKVAWVTVTKLKELNGNFTLPNKSGIEKPLFSSHSDYIKLAINAIRTKFPSPPKTQSI